MNFESNKSNEVQPSFVLESYVESMLNEYSVNYEELERTENSLTLRVDDSHFPEGTKLAGLDMDMMLTSVLERLANDHPELRLGSALDWRLTKDDDILIEIDFSEITDTQKM